MKEITVADGFESFVDFQMPQGRMRQLFANVRQNVPVRREIEIRTVCQRVYVRNQVQKVEELQVQKLCLTVLFKLFL